MCRSISHYRSVISEPLRKAQVVAAVLSERFVASEVTLQNGSGDRRRLSSEQVAVFEVKQQALKSPAEARPAVGALHSVLQVRYLTRFSQNSAQVRAGSDEPEESPPVHFHSQLIQRDDQVLAA